MKQTTGFTLIELMVVIAIIAIMSAVAVPNIFSWVQNRHFTSTVQRAVSILNSAKMHAVKDNRPSVVIFDKSGNRFKAFVDFSSPPNLQEDAGTDQVIDDFPIPPGVRISSSTFKAISDGRYRMVFNTRGMPAVLPSDTNSGTVVIANKSGLSNGVVVAPTGRIRVQ